MANPEHLKILKQGITSWNTWRQENPDIRPDLSEVSLSGVDLSKVNLNKADLSGAVLTKTCLSGANLTMTDLSGAALRGAILTTAKLTSADLRRADLRETDLTGADLTRVILRGSHLQRATLPYAILRQGDLWGADLRAANLNETDLRGADLSFTNLSEADLSLADLRWVNLTTANLCRTTLENTNFTNAQLNETLFNNVNLSSVKGLNECHHRRPSSLDYRTLLSSGSLHLSFLRGCGLPENWIEYLPSLLNQPIQFYSCFISYNQEDKAFARRLHDALQGRGIRCWLDEKQLLPGDDIYDGVQQGIRLWDKILLCASQNSLKSWWVDHEIESAFRKEQKLMRERKKKILALIPLDLDGHIFSSEWESGKKSLVLSRVVADFRGWDKDNEKFENELEKVIGALRADEAAREIPPLSRL